MSKPQRIQRMRRSGWRKPENTTCITRGGPWGNMFVVRGDLPAGTKIGSSTNPYFAVPTAADAVATYREYLAQNPDVVERARKYLRGKNLACYCALGDPCHGDVLLEVANG